MGLRIRLGAARARGIRRLGLIVWIALGLCLGCAIPEEKPERLLYTFQGSTMGTYFAVKLVRPAEQELSAEVQEQVMEEIEQSLDQVDRLMSTYRADSELSTFNASPSTDPFPLSAETFRVLEGALAVAESTGGALDVTVGPLVNAWGFGPDFEELPEMDQRQLEELRSRVGYHFLALSSDPRSPTVTKALPDLYVDLSSLAKGFAVDQTHARLSRLGYANLMVEVGGEVRASGVNLSGQAWRLGIERPASAFGSLQRIVALENMALATSGDYRNYRERNGVRLSHIIDPRTGRPIGHRLASVSVIDESCMRADALSTALMVLGSEEGPAYAEREGLSALFLVREGDTFREVASRAFQQKFIPGEYIPGGASPLSQASSETPSPDTAP